jgi:hypothetical protein
MFDILGTVTASANADGSLSIKREDTELRLLPVGTDRFIDPATGSLLVAKRDAAGSVEELASPLLNNVAIYERAPLKVRFAVPVLALTLPVLLLAGIMRLVQWFRRRREPRPLEQGLRHVVNLLAVAAPWLLILVTVAWPVSLLSGLASSPAVTFALRLFTLCAVAGAAALTYRAAAPSHGASHPTRPLRALVALAAASLASLHIAFSLTGV